MSDTETEASKPGQDGAPRPVRALAWILLYTLLVTMPVLVLVSGLSGGGSGWWFDFSMGLGFGSLALMGGQFLLTARFRRATAPVGIDVVYVTHRWLAVIGLGVAVGHYAVVRVLYPDTLVPLSPLEAPFHMTAGRLALAAFVVLVVSSLFRRGLGIEYDGWRMAHALLAVVGMVLALLHVRGVGYYSGVFWNRVVLDLFMGSLVALALYTRVVKPLLLKTLPYRVTHVRPEGARAHTLMLEPEGHSGMDFAPGQFGWLSLATTPWRAHEHPFSFSNPPTADGRIEMTIKAMGDFTSRIGETPTGTVAYIDGPHGIFSIDSHPEAPGFLFLAGGVGIAPIMSMLRAMERRKDPRPSVLVYGNRTWEGAAFRHELPALEERLDLRVVHVLQEPPPGWEGAVGMPRPELLHAASATLPDGFHVFICGPVAMNEMAQAVLSDAGVSLPRIHFELFEMA